MAMIRRDGRETRKRLLDAAEKIFAAKGFHEARTAEICRAAKANTAAVNYHFGSKENLYQEAWRYAFEKGVEAHPPDGGVPPEAPLEDRLRGRIKSIISRVMDPESLDFDIGHREMANPTGLLAEIMHRAFKPLHQDLVDLVGEYLGREASEQEITLGAMSINAQCLVPLSRERKTMKQPQKGLSLWPPLAEMGVETVVDHVLRFSLAGLKAMKIQLKSNSQATGAKG